MRSLCIKAGPNQIMRFSHTEKQKEFLPFQPEGCEDISKAGPLWGSEGAAAPGPALVASPITVVPWPVDSSAHPCLLCRMDLPWVSVCASS